VRREAHLEETLVGSGAHTLIREQLQILREREKESQIRNTHTLSYTRSRTAIHILPHAHTKHTHTISTCFQSLHTPTHTHTQHTHTRPSCFQSLSMTEASESTHHHTYSTHTHTHTHTHIHIHTHTHTYFILFYVILIKFNTHQALLFPKFVHNSEHLESQHVLP